jgi:acyl-CoA synthetase (AMP-forming)/AMP-acid ligase II
MFFSFSLGRAAFVARLYLEASRSLLSWLGVMKAGIVVFMLPLLTEKEQ